MNRIKKNRRGFTLVEMLAVVVIIGVLALVAIPAFLGSRAAAEDAACDANRRSLLASITNFQNRAGTLASTAETTLVTGAGIGSQMIAGNFLANVPTEPKAPASATPYKISVEDIVSSGASGVKVTIKCPLTSGAHGTDAALL